MPRSFDHEHIRFWTHARRRRQSQLVLALIVGLAAGAVAVLFEHGLEYAESLRFTLLGALAGNPLRWFIVPLLCGIAGATARMITGAWAPEASGSGIPHVKGVLLGLRSLKKRIIPVKFIGGMLAIGAGFSLGREGPTVQMGAVAGLAVAQMLKTPRRYRPQLIAAGAGAGLAAAFNAPLAGFVFVLEELQREMSPYTYGTALAATVVADVVTRSFMGQLPSFRITGIPIPPLGHLSLFLLLGLLCGLLGTLFNRGLPAAMTAMQRIPGPMWVKAGFVGVAVGVMALVFPCATGGGQRIAETILQGRAGALLSTVPFATGLLLVHQLLVIEDLRLEAERDPLTGVLNRHALASRLPLSLAGWALVAVDVDHFKEVNDQHGHAAGDRVLAFVGEVLRRHLREGDLAVRMGGEEFAVLLQGMHPSAAQAVAERLRCDLERLAAQGAGLPITASLGVALATPGIDFAALWSQADGALYRAKTLGRNRVECTEAPEGTP